jgi:1,4-alpha-glucan branching enzyme
MTSQIDLTITGDNSDPFALLGMHPIEDPAAKALIVRVFVPGAESVWVIEANQPDNQHPMHKIRDEGFFELTFPDRQDRFPYRLKASTRFGDSWEFYDPYSFLPLLSD